MESHELGQALLTASTVFGLLYAWSWLALWKLDNIALYVAGPIGLMFIAGLLLVLLA